MTLELKEPVGKSKSFLGFYAGFISRLLAFIIDTAILSFSAVAITWFLSVSATMLQFRTILGFSFNAVPGFKTFIDTLFGPRIGSAFFLIYVISYHVFFWVFAGQTPGKALIGLRVVPMRGGKLTWARAIFRFFCYCLSAAAFGLGFFWIIFDDCRLAWHDKLAGTCVIYTWEARPDETFLADEIEEVQGLGRDG